MYLVTYQYRYSNQAAASAATHLTRNTPFVLLEHLKRVWMKELEEINYGRHPKDRVFLAEIGILSFYELDDHEDAKALKKYKDTFVEITTDEHWGTEKAK